jgi:hypothetical protein
MVHFVLAGRECAALQAVELRGQGLDAVINRLMPLYTKTEEPQ